MYGFLPAFMIPPEWRLRQKQAEERFRKERLEKAKVEAIDWDELKTPWAPMLYLKASSWRPSVLFETPTVAVESGARGIVHEHWGYRHVWLRGGDTIETRGPKKQKGFCCFDGDISIPVLYQFCTEDVLMSPTPQEVFTQRRAITLAKGHVLIGGLGMGWLLRHVLAKPNVTKVTVVERSKSLLDWYGRRICAEDPRVTVICDDVYSVLHVDARGHALPGPVQHYDTVLLDIWSGLSDWRTDGRLRGVRERFGRRLWTWGV